jgi:predicted RNA-binding Zn-ribbon protein involved in translation (DUF1610 family)
MQIINVALCELIAAEVTFPATLKLPPSEVPLVTESVLPADISCNSQITIKDRIVRMQVVECCIVRTDRSRSNISRYT